MKKLRIVNNRITTQGFAEMIGIDHRDVLKKARKLLDDVGACSGKFYTTRLHVQKKEQPTLSLDRDLSVILAAQYSVKIAYYVGKEFNDNIKIDKNKDEATENVDDCLGDAIEDSVRDVIEASFDFSWSTRVFVSTNDVIHHLAGNSKLITNSFNNHRMIATVMGDLGIKRTRPFGKGRGYELPPMM